MELLPRAAAVRQRGAAARQCGGDGKLWPRAVRWRCGGGAVRHACGRWWGTMVHAGMGNLSQERWRRCGGAVQWRGGACGEMGRERRQCGGAVRFEGGMRGRWKALAESGTVWCGGAVARCGGGGGGARMRGRWGAGGAAAAVRRRRCGAAVRRCGAAAVRRCGAAVVARGENLKLMIKNH